MIEQLPKAFLERMKTMLGKEYEDFLKSYEAPRQFGLRVNTNSCDGFFVEVQPIVKACNGEIMGAEACQASLLCLRTLLSSRAECNGACCHFTG